MPSSRVGTIKLLQRALDSIGYPVLYHTTQFYSTRQKRPVTQYHIKKVVFEDDDRSSSEELFNTYYQLYVIFFLRDLWDYLNGRPEDMSNEIWNEYKRKHNISVKDVV